jgi:hypothetical protein
MKAIQAVRLISSAPWLILACSGGSQGPPSWQAGDPVFSASLLDTVQFVAEATIEGSATASACADMAVCPNSGNILAGESVPVTLGSALGGVVGGVDTIVLPSDTLARLRQFVGAMELKIIFVAHRVRLEQPLCGFNGEAAVSWNAPDSRTLGAVFVLASISKFYPSDKVFEQMGGGMTPSEAMLKIPMRVDIETIRAEVSQSFGRNPARRTLAEFSCDPTEGQTPPECSYRLSDCSSGP